MTLQEHIQNALAPIEPWVMAESTGHTDRNDESHRFLENLRDAVIDAIDEDGFLDTDRAAEIADEAPSIWNDTRMLEVTGLTAYNDEPEFGDGNDDIITVAGYVLYEVARATIDRLMERVAEAKESYVDQA